MVMGDVGKSIKPGSGKKIEWNAKDELGTYKGEITFKVKGEVVVPMLSFKNPVKGSSVRRGKNIVLQWEGGNTLQNVRLELYKGNEKLISLPEMKNNGSYQWSVPKDLTPGGDYSIKMASGQQNIASENFTVKRKVPFLLKVAPVLVVGGLLAVLLKPPSPNNSDLPVAPGPK
jgi:hypothetical protein